MTVCAGSSTTEKVGGRSAPPVARCVCNAEVAVKLSLDRHGKDMWSARIESPASFAASPADE